MKAKLHPKYEKASITCGSCGSIFETRSTKENLRIELCSNCHPYFTGEQRIVDTRGRVEQFKRRYGLQ